MDLGEEMIQYLTRYVIEQCAEDLNLFARFVDKNLMTTLQNVVENKFIRLPYAEAVAILEKSGQKFEYPVSYGIGPAIRT